MRVFSSSSTTRMRFTDSAKITSALECFEESNTEENAVKPTPSYFSNEYDGKTVGYKIGKDIKFNRFRHLLKLARRQ